MTNEKRIDLVDALNAQVGGDGDIGGIAQTISADDINAVLYSEHSIDIRRQSLQTMKQELQARLSADRGVEIAPLVEQVEAALAMLKSPAEN